MSDTPQGAGWFPDPTGRYARRYHDGASWTDTAADKPGEPVFDKFMAAPAAPVQPQPAPQPVQPQPMAAPVQPQPMWQQPQQASPAKRGMNGCLIAFLVVLGLGVVGIVVTFIVAAVAVDEAVEQADENLEDEEQREARNVEITACGTDQAGFMVATLEVTNDSSEPSLYFIDVVFESANGAQQFDSTTTSVDELGPGQTTTVEALTLTESPGPGVTCRVADVERLAA